MALILDGSLGLTTPGVVNTAGETIATTLSVTGVTTLTGGLNAALPVLSGGTGVTTKTGTGAVVLGTSPTLTTPTISSLSSASATALTLQSAGTTAITVDTSQNVVIATGNLTLSAALGVAKATYINSQALSAGSVSASANGTLINTSDATLKIADGYLESGLNKLNELQSRYFYFKDTEGNADYAEGRQLGFFAQEVQIAIGDEAAPPPPAGKHYSIHDRALIAVCVKAIQEQQALIIQLQADVATLKALSA